LWYTIMALRWVAASDGIIKPAVKTVEMTTQIIANKIDFFTIIPLSRTDLIDTFSFVAEV